MFQLPISNIKFLIMNSPVKNWRETKKLHKLLGIKGKIITWSKIFVPPAGFEHEAPYNVAIVQFENGKKMAVQVVDCDKEDLIEGQEVITTIRRIGRQSGDEVIEYGIKVKPL